MKLKYQNISFEVLILYIDVRYQIFVWSIFPSLLKFGINLHSTKSFPVDIFQCKLPPVGTGCKWTRSSIWGGKKFRFQSIQECPLRQRRPPNLPASTYANSTHRQKTPETLTANYVLRIISSPAPANFEAQKLTKTSSESDSFHLAMVLSHLFHYFHAIIWKCWEQYTISQKDRCNHGEHEIVSAIINLEI